MGKTKSSLLAPAGLEIPIVNLSSLYRDLMPMFSVPKHLPPILLKAFLTLSKDSFHVQPTIYKIHYSGLCGVNTQVQSGGSTSPGKRKNEITWKFLRALSVGKRVIIKK